MGMIDKDYLLKLLQHAFTNLIKLDTFVINNKAHEQCISGRLAMYFRECLIKLENQNIRVDVEYNRDKNDPKCQDQTITHDNNNPYIRPDILIHERGTNNNNILYCEIKKNSNSDKDKVKNQVYGNRQYDYGIDIFEINLKTIKFLLFEKVSITKKPERYSFDCNTFNLEITNE